MHTVYSDTMTIEGVEEVDSEEEYFAAMQRHVNSGMWMLQGSHGRTMMQAIENGDVLLGHKAARDYWGSRIPSRDEVQAGTKGSYDFVVEARGEDWANLMRDQP